MARTGPATQLAGIADLTLMAPVKQGFVAGAFGTHSYVFRLQVVLKTLNALRVRAREAAFDNPFSDAVGRIGTVQSIRFAVVPPEPGAGAAARHRLLLNVIFDRGWEPYLRFIWRDIGTLLDLIFCSCDGYPPAHLTSFDSYIRWVRDSEVQSDFFYVDSAQTIGDSRYLRRLEALHRGARDPQAADIESTALAVAENAQLATPPALQPVDLARRGLAPLAALYDLNQFFPLDPAAPGGGDAGFLLRASHDLLQEMRALPTQQLLPAASPERQRFGRALGWFELPKQARQPLPADRPQVDLAKVQGGILSGYEGITHGCLVLLAVVDRAAALAFLGALHARVATADKMPAAGAVATNVALTYQGLAALGAPPHELAKFPQEFREGMEARAGLLGDFRSNHPSEWRRPERNWPAPAPSSGGVRVELSTVHIVVQLRVAVAADSDPAITDLQHPLNASVQSLAEQPGVQVLSVQAMRRRPEPGTEISREHFGFRDGFSQPKIGSAAAGTHWSDRVRTGEILLGFGNERGDGPQPAQTDRLLDHGTFLVVRKLRQDVSALDKWLKTQVQALHAADPTIGLTEEQLKVRMMGRHLDGQPLVSAVGTSLNDFDFKLDPQGRQCPLQSHVRRSNPRNGSEARPLPRILRRGMSYGPAYAPGSEDAERGVVFMAYNASIAEQFEVVQRWIAGGNSSGVASAQSDPLLGVPQPGDPRTFRFFDDNRVLRVDLDTDPTKPFVKLEWGAYLFVPSTAALQMIATAAWPSVPQPAKAPPPVQPSAKEVQKRLLEDSDKRSTRWAAVRAAGGVEKTDYGVLVGSKAAVMEVFRDRAGNYSVAGYGERMGLSIGEGYLGLDDPAHAKLADVVNPIIESIDEPMAFAAARATTGAVLDKLLAGGQQATGKRETSFDIKEIAEPVLAMLCRSWFGLPDANQQIMRIGGWTPDAPVPPNCPGHFMSASRYIFNPDPSPAVQGFGKAHGSNLQQAVLKFVQNGVPGAAPLSSAIDAALRAQGADDDLVARTIAGVMMGFPPTVYANLVLTLMAWLKTRRLWELQNALLAKPGGIDHARAVSVLRGPLLRTMQQQPIPDMVYRKATRDHALHGVDVQQGDHVVVGILSAANEDAQAGHPDEAPIFGGLRDDPAAPAHACPGYEMAMGTLLGIFSALLEAGTLLQAGPSAVKLVGK